MNGATAMPSSTIDAVEDRKLAAKAIANEAGTDPFLLGWFLQEKTPAQALSLVRQTLFRAEGILAKNRKPDDTEAILAGEEFGVVFMPPELVRQLWGLGETVVHFRAGKAEAVRAEFRAIRVMELAAQWVQDARDRWGVPDRVEKVDVAPLLREQQEAPF